jgi:threonine/homoserine/homoserine lactone efflux protein
MDFSVWTAFAAASVVLLVIQEPKIAVVLADRAGPTIRRPDVLTWMERAGGTVLIGMGVLTATLRRVA